MARSRSRAPRTDHRAQARGGAVASALLLACGPASEAPRLLAIERFDQEEKSGVYLDETLTLYFSADLDPSSVTPESVRIRRPDGTPVAGRFVLTTSDRIEFRPALPTLPDLSDGGLYPGLEYSVEVVGFPRPDGVRGRRGEILPRSYRARFRTADDAEGAPLFFPLPREEARPFLVPVAGGRQIGPLDPILLQCEEPLDPTSIVASDFSLSRFLPRPPQGGGPPVEEIPLRARLAENTREGGARLALSPLGGARIPDSLRALDPGTYLLALREDRGRPKTTGGLSVIPLWIRDLSRHMRIQVVGPELGGTVETFTGEGRPSPRPVGAVDGTAHWSDAGHVTVRLPAAVGDGRLERVVLDGEEARNDVQATRLRVASGSTCDLSPAIGMVLLRAQTSVEVEGLLRRRVGELTPSILAALEGLEDGFRTPEGPRSLSSWIAANRAGPVPWTVVVCGGDLRVAGEIDVDGPLMLVAGGWIRVYGRVRGLEVWKTTGGGAIESASYPRPLPLTIDAPTTNPLRVPLSVAVLSQPILPARGVTRWRPAEVTGSAGLGSFSVRFLGERGVGSADVELFGPVGALELLEGCEQVQFLVELSVPAQAEADPAARWDPPRVERVQLSWYEPPRSPAGRKEPR